MKASNLLLLILAVLTVIGTFGCREPRNKDIPSSNSNSNIQESTSTKPPESASEMINEASAVRRQFAADLGRELREVRPGVYVATSGPDDTVLSIRTFEVGRPKLLEDEQLLNRIKNFGFTKLIFTDGNSRTTTKDL